MGDFHVPEASRLRVHPLLGTSEADGNNGCFSLSSPEPGWQLLIVASDGTDDLVPEAVGWEHVSVHAQRGAQERTPTWKEMCFVKRIFWDDTVLVMQLHPPELEYINCHPHTLHLWRPRHRTIPTPPQVCV